MTRPMIPAIALLAMMAGCASPGMLLEGRNDAYLIRGGERVELSPDDALIIQWVAADTVHSTAELHRKGRGSGQVRLVEASDQYLHVWSDDWNRPGDLDQDLLRGDLRLVPRSGRYRHPTVLIPVERITSVEVYGLLPRLKRPRLGDAWRGMAGGALGAMVGFASIAEEPGVPTEDESIDYLLGTLLVGAAGSVVYPVYHLFPPRYAEEPIEYRVGPNETCEIEVAPPR